MLTLRPYQNAAISSIYGYFQTNTGNPLVVIPTAGGKSLVMAAFIEGVLKSLARSAHPDRDPCARADRAEPCRDDRPLA